MWWNIIMVRGEVGKGIIFQILESLKVKFNCMKFSIFGNMVLDNK